MNTQNVSPWSTAFKYGIIVFIINAVIGLIFWFLGMKLSQLPFWIGVVMFFIFALMAMKAHREDLGGHISYGKALGVGVLMALVASILSAIYSYIFTTVIDPEIVDLAMAQQEEKMIERGMSEAQIDQAMSMSEKFMNPMAMSLVNLIMGFLLGLITSLIAAIFAKKDPPSSL